MTRPARFVLWIACLAAVAVVVRTAIAPSPDGTGARGGEPGAAVVAALQGAWSWARSQIEPDAPAAPVAVPAADSAAPPDPEAGRPDPTDPPDPLSRPDPRRSTAGRGDGEAEPGEAPDGVTDPVLPPPGGTSREQLLELAARNPELAAELLSEVEEGAPPDEEPEPEEEPEGFDPARLRALEEEAAQAAEALGLIAPDELERRIDERVPGSLPPEVMEAAREEARRKILAEAALVEDIVQSGTEPGDGWKEIQEKNDWVATLVPAWGDEYKAHKLEGVASRLGQ